MKSYALTLKALTDPNPTRMDYMMCISDLLNMFKKILVYNWAFETDSKHKLHIHTHIKCKYIHWKKFLELYNSKGYHVNVQELKSQEDCDRWDNYLNKQRLSPQECEQINVINDIYAQNYPFIEQEVVKTLNNDDTKRDGSLGATGSLDPAVSKVSVFRVSFN